MTYDGHLRPHCGDQMDRIEGKVDLALKLIRGESEPERSIIGRLASTERDVEDLKASRTEKRSFGLTVIHGAIAALLGAIAGYFTGSK